MSVNGTQLRTGTSSRGKYPVSLVRRDQVMLTDRIDPHQPKQIEAFLGRVQEEYPRVPIPPLRQTLLQLAAAPQARPASGLSDHPAELREDGLYLIKPTKEGPVPVRLANFGARITTDVAKDDGVEVIHAFEIEATMRGCASRFSIPADEFTAMNWVAGRMGPGAIVSAGQGLKDHPRAAIQSVSANFTRRTIYTHLGWRELDSGCAFLHAGGAIGADGPIKGVEVEVPDSLANYSLPSPPAGDELVACIRVSLRLLDLAPDSISVPMCAAIWRSVLGQTDLSLHLCGSTGVFKSELLALVLQHFGAGMDARHIPANWSSTANSLEGLSFTAKDVVLGVDDFAPAATQYEANAQHQKAERLLRAVGNRSGRQRMRADATLRPTKPPRSLIVSTGEDIPTGQSLRARMLILELGPSDVAPDALTACQEDARTGFYAGAMSGFLQWLAAWFPDAQAWARQQAIDLRNDAASSTMHRRTPDIVAQLAVGWYLFLDFAAEVGAISTAERRSLWSRGWAALGQAAARQAIYQAANEPATRFLELLASAFASGAAHLAASSGRAAPPNPAAWGWRQRVSGDGVRYEWQPQGTRIGWVDGDFIYLDPDASYKVAASMASAGGQITVTPQTLRKRLLERGLLVREAGRDELCVRRVLDGVQRSVLCLRRAAFPAAPAPSAPSPAGPSSGDTSDIDMAAALAEEAAGENGQHLNAHAQAAECS